MLASTRDRPQADDQADLQLFVTAYRGSAERLERMPYVADCLRFLAQKDIYTRPLPLGTSAPLELDGSYAPSTNNTCPGPVFLYHTYWKGPMNWRVELFIKGFLETQDLTCSQLWVWIDQNHDPNSSMDFLVNPRFRQFLPLLANNVLVLKTWTIPERVPLPSTFDHRDGKGFSRLPPKYMGNVTMIGDKVYEDDTGQQWLDFVFRKKLDVSPVTLSDIFRFVTLHLYGGIYLDMDVLLLRDLRPLLVPQQPFAERWGTHEGDGDYNTAVLYLDANSSLSSYFLRIGARLGHSFHPLILGDIARKDGRHKDLLMLEAGFFDPVWTEFDGKRKGDCASPCLKTFHDFFKNIVEEESDANISTIRDPENFFRGSFAYHIHNLVRRSYYLRRPWITSQKD